MRRMLPLAVAALLLAGCGDDTPSEQQQVRDALRTFATSVEERDYQTLCDDVFAPELLEGLQRIGLPCEVALRMSLGRVEEPRLTVGEVTIDGTRAQAEVRTSAEGQPPSTDTLELEKVSGRWRVTALGGDDAPAGSPAPSESPTATPKSEKERP